MGVPNIFANSTAAIPLSYLDVNFATPATLGNAAVGLGNTTTQVGNLVLANVTIQSGTINGTYANITNVALANLANISANTVVGNPTANAAAPIAMTGAQLRTGVLADTPPTAYTPFLTVNGSNVGITYGTQIGLYSITNGWCSFTVNVVLTSKGASSGVVRITTPVTTNATYETSFPVRFDALSAAEQVEYVGRAPVGSVTISFVKLTNGVSGLMQDSALTNTTQVYCSGIFPV